MILKKCWLIPQSASLGYMFLALGCRRIYTGVFHVMTHAFFKALLFLGAGSVIHAMGGEQDIRKMGGLKKLKITFITFLIGCIAIAGVPPFSGFFSKDAILLAAFEHNKILYVVALVWCHAYSLLYVPLVCDRLYREIQRNRRTRTSFA